MKNGLKNKITIIISGLVMTCFLCSFSIDPSINPTPIGSGKGILNENVSMPFIDLNGTGGGLPFYEDAIAKASEEETPEEPLITDSEDENKPEEDLDQPGSGKNDENIPEQDNEAEPSINYAELKAFHLVVEWKDAYFMEDPKMDIEDMLTMSKDMNKKIVLVDKYAESETYYDVIQLLAENEINDYDEEIEE